GTTGATEATTTGPVSESAATESTADTDVPDPEPLTLQLYDEVVFYDGYAGLVDAPVPAGLVRLRNSLYSRRLADVELAELDARPGALDLEVVIGALCDNYDRIGSVNLALTAKGVDTYDPAAVTRIEIGRF